MIFESIFPNIQLNPYIKAGAVLFAMFLILRIILTIAERIILKITSKTKTDLDDIILQKTSRPLTYLAFFISLIFALQEITLSTNVSDLLHKSTYTLLSITIGYLIFVIVDNSLVRVWKKLSEKTENDLDDTIGQLVHEVLRIVLIVIIFIYILNIWGIEIGPFIAGLGIAGLAVALALQPTLSNVFSGISIILDGTYKVGDVIKLQSGEMGTVHKIGLRTTRIKSFDNEMIIIPNSSIANATVQNFFQPDMSIRVNVEFGVEYGIDPEYIKKIVIEEIEKIKIIKPDEEVRVLFLAMGDSSLNFKAMFWVDDIAKKWPAHQEAITRIYRRLYKEKIGIPFPQSTVWLREEGKVKSPDPKDTKFKEVHEKYLSAFGHEYKEEEKDKKTIKKKESRTSKIFNRLKFQKKK